MTQDDRGRRSARDRAVLGAFVAGAGVQVATVLAAVISLPFVTRALSAAEYGVLTTLTGFLAVFAFADLGVGSALTTRLAAAVALEGSSDDAQGLAARRAVSTVLVAALAITGVLALLGVLAAFLVPWATVLGAATIPASVLTASALATVIGTALSVPASLGQRILYGMHRGATANRWLIVSVAVTATGSILAALASAPLLVFVVVSVGTPSAVGLLCTLWVVGSDPRVRPSRSLVSREEWSALRHDSGWYFVVALSGAVGFQTDILFVAGVLGASSAAVFSVASRVFGLITQALYPGLLQLWPLFTDASVRGDHRWVRSRLVRATIAVGVLSTFGSLVLVAWGDVVIGHWLTAELVPTMGLLWALGAWTVFGLVQAPTYLLFNGVGRVRAHGLMAAAVALANVPLSFWLVHAIGVEGPVIASLIASVVILAFPGLFVLRGILNASDAGSDASHVR